MNKLLVEGNSDKHPKELDDGGNERYLVPDPIEGDSFNSKDFTMLVMA